MNLVNGHGLKYNVLQNLHIVESRQASKSLFVKASKHVKSEISEIKDFLCTIKKLKNHTGIK